MNVQFEHNAIVRFHVETEDRKEAERVAHLCERYLQEFGECKIDEVEKYWKFEEYYEILIRMNIENIDKKTVAKIANGMGPRMEVIADDFIWVKDEQSTFLDPKVHWGYFSVVTGYDLE